MFDIESHPQPGIASRFYRWTIFQIVVKIVIADKLECLEGIKHYTIDINVYGNFKEHIVVCIQWC